MSDQVKATKTEDGIMLTGLPEVFMRTSCQIAPLDNQKFMIHTSSSDITSATTVGRSSRAAIYDLLLGIHRREWTGKVRIELGNTAKILFFKSGEFVFATSDLIDDRLGEVIYRDEIISLDQLTSFAVQVDRKNKFGQVLLRSGAFSSLDLWKALKAQASEILRSIFLMDVCYLEIHNGSPPIFLSFEGKTQELIETAYAYGVNFSVFKSRLKPTCSIILKAHSHSSKHTKGSFLNDMLEMCKDRPTVEVLLKRSKLSETNTIVTIMKLVSNNQIQITGLSEVTTQLPLSRQALLDNSISVYKSLLKKSRETFEKASVEFPIQNLMTFAVMLNSDGGDAIYLDEKGELTPDSIVNIYQQCFANRTRIESFHSKIEALGRFLYQFSCDLLPQDSLVAIKSAAAGI